MAGNTMTKPLSSPEEVLRLLGVASRNLSMYSREHPAYQRVLRELEQALTSLLEERKRLSIQMTPQHLLADGRVLPHNPLLHSMATELLRKGIQGFTLGRGVGEAELNVLLDILSRRMPEGGGIALLRAGTAPRLGEAHLDPSCEGHPCPPRYSGR